MPHELHRDARQGRHRTDDRQRAPADQAARVKTRTGPPIEAPLLVLTECVHASEVVLDAALGTRVEASAAQPARGALRMLCAGQRPRQTLGTNVTIMIDWWPALLRSSRLPSWVPAAHRPGGRPSPRRPWPGPA